MESGEMVCGRVVNSFLTVLIPLFKGVTCGNGVGKVGDSSRYDKPKNSSRAFTSFRGRYEGRWVDGLPHGHGVWRDSWKGLRYEGDWVKGHPHGSGTYTGVG